MRSTAAFSPRRSLPPTWSAPAYPDNHLYGKATCPHCVRAKGYFADAGIEYVYHDVVKDPRALYEMLGRVKPIVGSKTPITVPQIWIDGKYMGGADQLGHFLGLTVEPNPDRGQNSMTAKPSLVCP